VSLGHCCASLKRLRDAILAPIIPTINPDDSSDSDSDNEEF